MSLLPLPKTSGATDERVCRCGSSWFDLVRVDADGHLQVSAALQRRLEYVASDAKTVEIVD